VAKSLILLFEEISPSFVVAMAPSFYISPPQQFFMDVACIVGYVGSSQYVLVLLFSSSHVPFLQLWRLVGVENSSSTS
jgi:hypothetical protein